MEKKQRKIQREMKETKIIVGRIEKIKREEGENPWEYEMEWGEIIENKKES